MNCLIYGAGSLGTVLGAYLWKNNCPVTLCSRNKEHVAALNERGAVITGTEAFTQPVKAVLPTELCGEYDIIFLLTKQNENEKTALFLKQFLSEDGILVTFQNGIPEPALREILGPKHVLGCIVEWGATLMEPGHCEITSGRNCFVFRLEKNEQANAAITYEIMRLLTKMCDVEWEENFDGVRWSKLLINATFSGLGTVIGGHFGDVYKTARGRDVAARCVKECIDVARAAGVRIAKVQGIDITKLFYYKTGIGRLRGRLLIPIALKSARMIYPSMLQDLEKGKRCEIASIDGLVALYGELYFVKTPVCNRIVEIVREAEEQIIKAAPKERMACLKACLNRDNLGKFTEK